jgi:hypothetical protein
LIITSVGSGKTVLILILMSREGRSQGEGFRIQNSEFRSQEPGARSREPGARSSEVPEVQGFRGAASADHSDFWLLNPDSWFQKLDLMDARRE